MKPPEIVEEILRLYDSGCGKKKIARSLGVSVNTVRKFLKSKEWQPYKKRPATSQLSNVSDWLIDNFYQHGGNAAVLYQELKRQHNITVSLRSVERAVKSLRDQLVSEQKATVRFETPPGKQMQIDFGSMNLKIAGEKRRVYFFAAILGYSRRQYVQAFTHERQSSWFQGMEGAFRRFNGIPEQILLDNARCLVTSHNPATREVVFNNALRNFASYWKFTPKACAPYRARTKGKDENTVKYIKRNAIAGREFETWEALEQHLLWWMREISDERIHGTTGEAPIERFERDEKTQLKTLEGKPPFYQIHEVIRTVQTDACIEFGTNHYSVPWKFIRARVTVQVCESDLRIFSAGQEIAHHALCAGQYQRIIKAEHLKGIVGTTVKMEMPLIQGVLLRSLTEYETAVGGRL